MEIVLLNRSVASCSCSLLKRVWLWTEIHSLTLPKTAMSIFNGKMQAVYHLPRELFCSRCSHSPPESNSTCTTGMDSCVGFVSYNFNWLTNPVLRENNK